MASVYPHDGPAQMSMNDVGPGLVGATEISKGMTNKHNFHIVYEVQGAGCCRCEFCCGCCTPALRGRSYAVVGENFVETNHPMACLCCCVRDNISKTYFDMHPYKVGFCDKVDKCCCGCLGCGEPTYVTEHDTCYCCYIFPCMCIYDCCSRPCFGGKVGRSPFKRDSICFLLDTRCFGGAAIKGIFSFVKDSKVTAAVLQKHTEAFQQRRGFVY